MRRIPTALLVAFILMVSMVTPVFATAEIEITRQSQNSVFPKNASEKAWIPSESNAGNAVLSPLIITLSAAGGVAVISGGITGVILVRRKKKH